MGARGPKSEHETNTAHLRVVARQRVVCPKHLPPLAREAWELIVSTKAAAHFMPSDTALLEAYCLQYAVQRNVQAKLNRTMRRGGDLDPAHLKALSICAQRMASLATKLRLAPNARVAADAPQDDPLPRADAPQPPAGKRAGLMFEG